MVGGMVRVLLVEDDKIDRMAVQRMVHKNQLPYTLVTATSSADARDRLAEDRFDIVLLDYLLGDGTGLELLEETGTTPVIIVTGAGSEEIAVRAMRAGAYDYLIKDQEGKFLTVLPVTIESVLERRRAELALAESEERYRGMAEFADSVIHNAGNVLSSIQTSCELMRDRSRRSKLTQLRKTVPLVEQGLTGELDAARAEQLPKYLASVVEVLDRENSETDREVLDILGKLELVKNIVKTQQDRRKAMERIEELVLADLVEETLKILRPLLLEHGIQTEVVLTAQAAVRTDRTTLTHVLINVVKNAAEAMFETENPRTLTIESGWIDDDRAHLTVTDSGIGIEPEHVNRLFTHGFTTKQRGHGFGLHYCAHVMKELGGQIEVESPGKGEGASVRMIMAARKNVSS